TLGKLRGVAGFMEPRPLALDDPRVAGQEPLALERDAQVRIGLDERAGDPVPDRSCLAAGPAAVDADANVELTLDLGDLKRGEGELAMDDAREVLLDRAPVEPSRAVAGSQDHARDRGLPLAGAAVLSLLGHYERTSSCVG